MRLVLAGLILLIMERLVFGRNIISPLRNAKTTVGILVAGLLILVLAGGSLGRTLVRF